MNSIPKPNKQTKKKKRKQRTPYQIQKDKTWKSFSKLIRTRDCLRTTATVTHGNCCTCDITFEFSALQAGHYTQGRHNSTLFNEKNVHAQCTRCNMFLGGNLTKYTIFMLNKYGQKTIEMLDKIDNETRKFSLDELKKMEEQYKQRIKQFEGGA